MSEEPDKDSYTYKWLQSELRTNAKIIGEQQDEINRLSAESALKNEVVRAAQNLMRQPRRNSNPRYGAAWERLDAALNAVSNRRDGEVAARIAQGQRERKRV